MSSEDRGEVREKYQESERMASDTDKMRHHQAS